MFEEISMKSYSPEIAENDLEKQKQEVIKHIKEVEKRNNSIGAGRTAEVFYSETDPSICYKIIKNSELYFNDVFQEGEFLAELLKIKDSEVKSPRPHYSLMVKENGTAYHVLVMEKLAAISIDDLLTEKESEIPEGFDFKDFFKRVEVFLEKMHRAGIYHRDAHAGNIMIEKETGRPCIIDFGTAKKNILSSEDPYKKVDGKGVITPFPDDFDELQRVRVQMRDYILRSRQTV